MLHCNNMKCKYNDDLNCIAGDVYYIDRLCVTFRNRPREPNYRELMRSNVGVCHREHGKMRGNSKGVLK